MAEFQAVSMVGGTIRRKLIHRESFRASVLQTLTRKRCEQHWGEPVSLDNAFVLIEGRPSAAVVLQGVLFGIAHGYQGFQAIVMIMLFGFLDGILAFWRKSLRPGMVLHAWSDIYAGYLSQFMHL